MKEWLEYASEHLDIVGDLCDNGFSELPSRFAALLPTQPFVPLWKTRQEFWSAAEELLEHTSADLLAAPDAILLPESIRDLDHREMRHRVIGVTRHGMLFCFERCHELTEQRPYLVPALGDDVLRAVRVRAGKLLKAVTPETPLAVMLGYAGILGEVFEQRQTLEQVPPPSPSPVDSYLGTLFCAAAELTTNAESALKPLMEELDCAFGVR